MTANDFVPKLFLTLPSPDFAEPGNNTEQPFNSTPLSYLTGKKNPTGFKNEAKDLSFCVPTKEKSGITYRKLLSSTLIDDDAEGASSGVIPLNSSICQDGHSAQGSISSAIEFNYSAKHSFNSSIGSNHSFYMDSSLPVKNLRGASYTNVTPFSPLPPSPVSCKSDTTEQVQRMRRKMNKVKGELEVERLRNRRLQASRAHELQRLKNQFEDDRRQISLSDTSQSELEQILERLRKEKDRELHEVFKYKDEEVKQLKRLFALEKDDSIRVALEIQAQEMRKRDGLTYVRTVEKLKDEMRLLRSLNKTLEQHYQMKCQQDDEKSRELNRIKEEFRAEFGRMLSSNKLVSLRELDKMRHLEKSLFGEDSCLLEATDNRVLPSVSCTSRGRSVSYQETPKLNSSTEFPENDCSRSESMASVDSFFNLFPPEASVPSCPSHLPIKFICETDLRSK